MGNLSRIHTLIFCLMAAGILACMLAIGAMLWEFRDNRIPAGAQLVRKEHACACI